MRFAVYNQMFGLNGKSLHSNIKGHWAIHFQTDMRKVWKMADLNRTVDIIGRAGAEVIGICELLEGQEAELALKLKPLGYAHFVFGFGHRTKSGHLVMAGIASKIRFKAESINGFPATDSIGGGGGIAACHFPELNLLVIITHLAAHRKTLRSRQLKFLQDYIRSKSGRIVLMGDFNMRSDELKRQFQGFTIASGGVRSCSLTPVLKWLYSKDVDHILVNGLNAKGFGAIEGYSDHRLVYADLEQNFFKLDRNA